MQPDANYTRYLNHLAKAYPSPETVAEAIINLQAQLNLPKGTEHFISDIHGEFDAFFQGGQPCLRRDQAQDRRDF